MAGSASKAVGDEPATPCSLWSDLPADLAGLVLPRLPSYADRARFALVCRHWRYAAKPVLQSSLPSPPTLPWLKIVDAKGDTFRSLPDGELHRIPAQQAPLLSANMGWLLFKDADGRHYLKNPLSGEILRLPGHCKPPAIRHDLQPYSSSSSSSSSSSGSSSDEFKIRKLIVSTRDDAIAALISHHGLPPGVACCRPADNNNDATWAWSTGQVISPFAGDAIRYEDMAVFQGRAYTVTPGGDLVAHDIIRRLGSTAADVEVEPRVGHVIRANADQLDGAYASLPCGRRSYLATSARGDRLRLVRWIVPYKVRWNPESAAAAAKTMAFKVFEAADMDKDGGGRWVELQRLDDGEVLFLSADCSKAMSIDSSTLSSSPSSSSKIYFADCDPSWFRGRPASICPLRTTCGVYDMRTKVVSRISSKWPISDRTHAAWFFPFVEHSMV
ncbi:hypothetical protein BRADI_1g20545v3 [Brachypodium distachyon]|uniref:DUF295 domain-containing protein n=1 Tax=Brachypodium distachyon TaxID=15368 RepID=A0A0Q3GVU8_BRADI|nr:hypothetical protein BRADI_1g20545v3 [Brachypodium distachyon]